MRNHLLDALIPRTRQTLLSVLLLEPERRWYLSDLAHHIGVVPSTLQRELASLTEAGVLLREQDGNRIYYRPDSRFPIMTELRSIFAKTTGVFSQIADFLEPFHDGIAFAFIFGSYAREEQTAKSDIDLMLIGNISMSTLSLPLRKVEEKIGIEVNVSLYTAEEFLEKWRGGNHFVATVMGDRKIYLKGTEHELAIAAGSPQSAAA